MALDLRYYAVEYHLSPEHKKKQRKGEQKLHFKQIALKNARNNLCIKKTTDPHLANLYNSVFQPLVLPGYQLRRLGKPQTAAFFQLRETAFYNPAKRKPNMHWILKHSGIWPQFFSSRYRVLQIFRVYTHSFQGVLTC